MFLKNRLERFMSKVNAYDSWGGGGWGESDSGSVGSGFGSPGSGTGGDFGRGGGSQGSISEDLASLEAEVQAGYEAEMGRAATTAEKSFLATAIDLASFVAPLGSFLNIGSKATTGKSLGQNIAAEIAKRGVSDPYAEAAKGGSFSSYGKQSANDTSALGNGRDFVDIATNTIVKSVYGLKQSGEQSGDLPSYTPPGNIQTGMNQFVADSKAITDDYNARADRIWDDYLDFENVYFGKYDAVQNDYQNNLSSIPKLNLKLPDTMGGSTLPLAPKVHSAMYSDQANAWGDLIGKQAQTALAGISSRNSVNNNKFNVNQTGLNNNLLPTNTALDLYKMERASQLGLNNALAVADANKPSTLSTWAPVVGTLLSSNGSGGTNLSSAWDFIKGLWS